MVINVICTVLNFLFALVRTYYAKYAEKTYEGSVKYWNSWEKRRKDVLRDLLVEIEAESPEELKAFLQDYRKKKKKRKKKRRRKR